MSVQIKHYVIILILISVITFQPGYSSQRHHFDIFNNELLSGLELNLKNNQNCLELNSRNERLVRTRSTLTSIVAEIYDENYRYLIKDERIDTHLYKKKPIVCQENFQNESACSMMFNSIIEPNLIYDMKNSCTNHTDLIFSAHQLVFDVNFIDVIVEKHNIVLCPPRDLDCYLRKIVIIPHASPIFINGSVNFMSMYFKKFSITNAHLILFTRSKI